jgi:2-polyprenyl-3-methyl-5-hydroxy-6-metoxy-1,4-benzoquinol methylase
LNHFDGKAQGWERDPMKLERALVAGRAIAGMVPVGGQRILDYGCGTGLLGFALQPQAAHVTLADASDGMLGVVREKITASGVANVTPLRLDLQVDPLPTERFGLVCSLLALHHIPDTLDLLRKFHTLLEPGGWVALLDLDREDGSFHGPEAEVHRGFDRGTFRAELELAGFSRVALSDAFDIQREPERGGGRYPVFLAVARKD